MLRIHAQSNAGAAKTYFTQSLDRGDYYLDSQELAGCWHGRGAERLELAGEVAREDYFRLCENRHPATGNPLTARTKDNRRVGYDISFHAPKSVSAIYSLVEDSSVLEIFREAVGATMKDIERDMECRVRIGGAQENRRTGNLVWAEFVHQTARPIGGTPDPHLHAHCFAMNATFDETEGRWKAGQFGNIKKDATYYEAAFHQRLRRGLELAGYRTETKGKFFELANVSEQTISEFSRRTAQIEAKAEALGITDPTLKSELGARTRENKLKAASMDDLRTEWIKRVGEREFSRLKGLKGKPLDDARLKRHDSQVAKEATEFAVRHVFERDSVISEKQLLAVAMREAGPLSTPEAVAEAVQQHQSLLRREIDGRTLVTTREVYSEEQRMLAFARDGRGRCKQFAKGELGSRQTHLNDDQRRAFEALLSSRDQVTVLRGGAGTGKTTMMRAVVEEIERGGSRVHAFAPSSDASRGVLRQEGFKDADTVAKLLSDDVLQKQLRGQVLWVDEAGLLGTRTMSQLFDVASKQKARVLLTGDYKQHGAVERGGPFRLLATEAGVRSATLTDIQRQRGEYKKIVSDVSDGERAKAFRRMDELGYVKQMPEGQAHQEIAENYCQRVKQKVSQLVVAPTHAEGGRLTEAIRARLKDEKLIDKKDRTFTQFRSLHTSEAERKDVSTYKNGQVICFHKNTRGFRAGEQTSVVGADPLGNVWVKGKMGPMLLKTSEADRYNIFEKQKANFAKGDTIRITRNGKTLDDGHALRNGATYKVAGFVLGEGHIILENRWIVSKHFGHITHGYVVTSHASQGKTVDYVTVAQNSASFGASNAEQFYVSVSRGRQSVEVYTDDKAGLLRRIEKQDAKLHSKDVHQEARVNPLPEPEVSRTHERDKDRDR